MALQTINLGSAANNGTGDDLREAFQKVVFNFEQLDARTPEATTAINLGNGQGVFANKNNDQLEFKTLLAGNNVGLMADGETITVNVDAGVTQFVIASDAGSVSVTENSTITLAGGTLISTERDGNSIRINSNALATIEEDLNPTLGAGLNANGHSIASVGNIDAVSISGNLSGLVYGIDVREINQYREPNTWDFGGIGSVTVTNIFDWVFNTYSVDFGSISGPQLNITVDLGSITE